MKINPNDPITGMQPFFNPLNNQQWDGFAGLTKREYFAAMAMQGILANPQTVKDIEENAFNDGPSRVVFSAVTVADALIAELNK